MSRIPFSLAALCAVATLAVTGCGSDDDATGTSASRTAADASAAAPAKPPTKTGVAILDADVSKTTGPNDEVPTDANDVKFTDTEVAQLKDKKASAAFAWAATSPFIEAVQAGATDEFGRLGISISSSTQANFDAGQQVNQLQTATSKKPAVMLTNPVDPATAGKAYDKLTAAGTKLVFLSNAPVGYAAGADYVGIVTDDLQDMGARAADSLAKAIGDKGKIGVVYFDVPFFVVNQRDGAFASRMRAAHPGVEIAATSGFKDPAKAGEAASAMLAKNRDLDGVYVSWSQPAVAVLGALKAAGNRDAKVVTMDLDDTVVSNMVTGGQVQAVIADKAYELGRGMAAAAAASLLDREVSPFSIVGSVTVTKDNVAQSYQESLRQPPSAAVRKAMNQG